MNLDKAMGDWALYIKQWYLGENIIYSVLPSHFTHEVIDTCLPPIAAAAAAKSLQSCPMLCDPIDGSPPGSSVHGIFQVRVLEWVAIAFSTTYSYLASKQGLFCYLPAQHR